MNNAHHVVLGTIQDVYASSENDLENDFLEIAAVHSSSHQRIAQKHN